MIKKVENILWSVLIGLIGGSGMLMLCLYLLGFIPVVGLVIYVSVLFAIIVGLAIYEWFGRIDKTRSKNNSEKREHD